MSVNFHVGRTPVIKFAMGDDLGNGVFVGRGNALLKMDDGVQLTLPDGTVLTGVQLRQALVALATIAEQTT